MSKLTVSIETDDAAFAENEGAEVARILRKLADRIDDGPLRAAVGDVLDLNGNRVGAMTFEDGDR